MAFVEIELARIDKAVGGLCTGRNRPDLQQLLSLQYRISGHDVVVYERRPHYDGRPGHTEGGVAKFKFIRRRGEWYLFWMRADLKWHRYVPLPSDVDLGRLVAEVDKDAHGCFFG
jgi:hypothetical protein